MDNDFEISGGVLTDYLGESERPIIPNGICEIGEAAFMSSPVTSVEIPSGVRTIGDSAFEGCEELSRVILPEGLTSIGDSAFMDCENLTHIVLPQSLVEIGDYAFLNCSALRGVEIPPSVKKIGTDAFARENLSATDKDDCGETRDADSSGDGYLPDYSVRSVRSELKDKDKPISSYYEEGEKEFITLQGQRATSVKKAIFGIPMFAVAMLWIVFDFGMLIVMGVSGIFAENAVSLVVFPFFAVHLFPVYMWIGGIVKAIKGARSVFTVTDRALYKCDDKILFIVRLQDMRSARPSADKTVSIDLTDGTVFKLDGIKYPKDFSVRLERLISKQN